jgi:copper transport protein
MRLRLLARLFAVAALVGALVIAFAAPAFAHASLENSDPADGTTVATSPPQITLTFSEDVELPLGSISLFNCEGKQIDIGKAHHGKNATEVVATLPALPPSQYQVVWRVISADSHPVHGAVIFKVGAGASSACNTSAASASAKSSKEVGVIYGIGRAGLFIGIALLIGATTFLVLIARGTSAARRCRTIAWTGWFVVLFSTIVTVLLQGPYGAGRGLGDAFKWAIIDDVLKSRYGHIAELRLLFLLAAVPLLLIERRSSESRPLNRFWIVSAIVVGLLIASTPGLAGHAATGDNVIFAVPFDTLHVAAMSVWLGGLFALLVAAIGGGFSGGLRRALVRFSTTALICVIVLVLTGLFASWRQVGFTIAGYFDTSYGNILLVKVGLVAVMVAIGAVSRSIVQKRRAAPLDAPDSAIAAIDERTVGGLRRSVGAEVLIGIIVLAVTALLVQAQPARSALTPTLFAAEVKAGEGDNAMLIDLTISPARVGPNQIHIYTLKPDQTNLTITKITADMALPGKGIDSLPVDLHRGGPNHFLADAQLIPKSGKWKMAIHVLRGQINDTAAVIAVPIR